MKDTCSFIFTKTCSEVSPSSAASCRNAPQCCAAEAWGLYGSDWQMNLPVLKWRRQKSSSSRRARECWTIPAKREIPLKLFSLLVCLSLSWNQSPSSLCIYLQQLDVDQLLWTRRALQKILTQRRPLHFPLLLVGKLEERERRRERRGTEQQKKGRK